MFQGPEDEIKALDWMYEHLRDQYFDTSNKSQKKEIDDLMNEIKTRIDDVKNEYISSCDLHSNLWDRFIFCMTGKWMDEQDEKWSSPYELGEWNFDDAQETDIGHSDFLIKTDIPKGGGSAKHHYSQVPDVVSWKLTPMTQKGFTFYIGKAKVSEIDAVCSVPQLPAELNSAETASRVLDPTKGQNQWQRRVIPKRILSIANFIKSPHNIIANSAILYCPSANAVSTQPNGDIKIDFGKFLYQKQDSNWCDHKGNIDLRPIWLIDGQHRTRGLAQSLDGINLEIPIIYFPPEFNLEKSAKIFAEINTLQVKLSALHTLFMQHRFKIPSPTGKRDFTAGWESGKPELHNSRANHLSYECAAYLASNEGGPLYNRIKILDQNSSQFPISQATQWLDFSRSWFSDASIYGPGCPESQDEINVEVENYFRAFVNTCNHGEWKDKKNRWCLKSSPKGLLQRMGPSQALLRIYPTVWMKAKEIESDIVPIPVKVFEEVLRPLKWVDWLDPRMKRYSASGEPPRTSLRIWLTTAIIHGECYSEEEVMSDSLKSKPGRGILAPPGNSKITSVDDKKWPAPGKPVILRVKRPHHARPTSRWLWEDNTGQNRTPPNKQSVQATNDTAEVVIRHSAWMNDIDYLEVRVDWDNQFGPPGFGKIKLQKK